MVVASEQQTTLKLIETVRSPLNRLDVALLTVKSLLGQTVLYSMQLTNCLCFSSTACLLLEAQDAETKFMPAVLINPTKQALKAVASVVAVALLSLRSCLNLPQGSSFILSRFILINSNSQKGERQRLIRRAL